jgi:hypothetical protein
VPTRVFKTRTFARSLKESGVTDKALWAAVMEMESGLVDADLGGHVVKKRVPIPGHGKRGGARTLVATSFQERWFYLYGFKKNERANVTKDELRALRQIAKEILSLTARQLDIALHAGELFEVMNDSNET